MAGLYQREYAWYRRYFVLLRRFYQERPEIRVYLGILLSALTISFFAIFALRPTLNTIATLFSEIKTQEEVLEKLERKVSDLARAQAEWNSVQQQLTLVEQAIPQNPDLAIFIRQIEGLAVRRGVVVSSINVDEVILRGVGKQKTQPQNLKNPLGTSLMTFSLLVSGSYPNLSSFLSDLAVLRKPLVFETVQLAVGGDGTLRLTLTGGVPYLREEIK